MEELDEVVGEFLIESAENLDRMDADLLALEQSAGDSELLAGIFRAIHTIKGTCGFFGFARLERLAHVAENLLGRLRDGELAVDCQIASALLATTDALRTMLAAIQATGEDGPEDFDDLVAELTRLQDGPPVAPEPPPQAEARVPRLGELLIASGAVTAEAIDAAAAQQLLDGDSRPLGEILIARGDVTREVIEEALGQQQARVTESSVRVDVGLLEQLMNLVGELVLARNQLLELDGGTTDPARGAALQRLNHITTELQDGVIRTRMQPIGSIWGKFPRVVRDLSKQFDKQVRVVLEGQETELDRTVAEAIKDPLTHLVRNAIDHGLESADIRAAAGKPREGSLHLRAFHEGGQVHIEIADDGAGIDAERLRTAAVERGIIGPAAAERMDQRESLQLIFSPGLSTSREVTSVSGRGVGMDVVKTNIEGIGGTIDVVTEPGRGTTFRLRIPLTLAIVPALIVRAGGQRFALPQVSLVELVNLPAGAAGAGVEHFHEAPVFRLRDRLLPLVHLGCELGVGEWRLEAGGTIAVLQTDGQQLGLVIDEVNDTQEIVVKPLDPRLRNLGVYAGTTIMGNGDVALILDVGGLARRGGVIRAASSVALVESSPAEPEQAPAASLLVVDLGGDHRAAVPLTDVDRLEEVSAGDVERSSDGPVVRYRGELLPLVSLPDVLGVGALDLDRSSYEVVVHQGASGRVGLMVGRIVDIVDSDLGQLAAARRPGITGSAVLAGRVTDVVDLAAVLPGPLEVA